MHCLRFLCRINLWKLKEVYSRNLRKTIFSKLLVQVNLNQMIKDIISTVDVVDIVERFTLALMLVFIAFRNLIELSGSEFSLADGFVMPKSFGWFRGNNILWTISYVCIPFSLTDIIINCPSACSHGYAVRNAG
jgi:hypothetical protein